MARATLDDKVTASRAFWEWRLGPGWDEVEASGYAHLEARIGPSEASWRLDGGRFPQLSASRHRLGDTPVWITATTGLSAQRMPQVEQFVDDPSTVGRVELAVACSSAMDQAREAVAGPASIPFSRMTWLGDGHTATGPRRHAAGLRRTGGRAAAHDGPAGRCPSDAS